MQSASCAGAVQYGNPARGSVPGALPASTAEEPGLMPRGGTHGQGLIERGLRRHQTKTDAEVEGIPEVSLGHLTVVLQPAEQGRARPAAGIDAGVNPGGAGRGADSRAGPTGDVGHAVQLDTGLLQRLNQGAIQKGGLQHRLQQGTPPAPGVSAVTPRASGCGARD